MKSESSLHSSSSSVDDAVLYSAYHNLTTDFASSIEQLKTLAASGNQLAMLYIAEAYDRGKGTSVDLAEAAKWYRIAAERGSLLARFSLARILYRQEQFAEARCTLELASDKDYGPAAFLLGRMYLSGRGGEKNPVKAEHLIWRASKLGTIAASASLANIYLRRRSNLFEVAKGLALTLRCVIDLVYVLVTEGPSSDRLR